MPTIKQLLYILLISLHFSCQKKYDIPPLKSLESASKINIVQVKSKFNNGSYRFKGDSNLYCVVIADEISGNLYKEIYVQDITGGIHIKLNNSGGLFIGDSLRINLQNCILNANNNLIQLDSVDTGKKHCEIGQWTITKSKKHRLKTNLCQFCITIVFGAITTS